ncbi:interleukin-31 receptor subunit alpha [Sciurus carolinensis]|uniref:interleukin-31 receptor subunit alpha n=1 Tax=Sciurus carolinensis TaxID=30640 RepID=UPI001FB49AFE|nr:interleukin-31 receptor subunit alpha [Sciurus carolinensis]
MWMWALWILPLLYKFSLTALPAKPENTSCILYYKKNLTCTWSPEKETSYTKYVVKRTYSYGNKRDICKANSSTGTWCSFFSPTITPPDYFTIEVEAQNKDGIVTSDITHWTLNSIVKMEPPKILSVKPILGFKKMMQIKWELYDSLFSSSNLNYALRFRTVNSTHWVKVNFQSDDLVYNLKGLQAFTEYIVAMQCVVDGSYFWSDWSQEKMGITEEEVPSGLDLWRVLRPAEVDGRRPVQLLWKKARGAPVLEKTFGYIISYFPENNTNLTQTINTTTQQCELHLGGKTYWVSVASYNSLGKSPVATMRIPAVGEKPFQCIEAMRVFLVQDLLVVEWQSSAPEVDTWMVEWFPDLDLEPSDISWESVSQARNWTIPQDKLKPFCLYNISVYPLLQDEVGEPYSIPAYAKEGIPIEGPVAKAENIGVKTVTITWKEIPKSKRNGFISNYTIFYQAEGGKEFSKTVDSSIQQYDLESLTRRTSYTARVLARTRAGEKNGTEINFKTLSLSVFEIVLITSLVGGGLLIFTVLTVASGLKKPIKLSHLCWPDIPNPAKSSIATWNGHACKNKSNIKEFDGSANTEDSILKSYSAPSDLTDKLVVNFENFLEEVSTEETEKSQENILGGEKNEYVTSPNRPDCPPGKSLKVLTEIPSGKSQLSYLGMSEENFSEAEEQLLSSGESLDQGYFCEEGASNPYLKNSVTTREFLVHEKLPDHTKKEV